MTTPPPINGIRTRVQRIAGAGPGRTDGYHAEFTTDSLTWRSIEGFTRADLEDAKAICQRFAYAAMVTPPVGITAWEG